MLLSPFGRYLPTTMLVFTKSAPQQLLLAALVAGLYGRSACAQITSAGDTVLFRSDVAGTRVEPQYQATPLVIGPMLATIALTARLATDSNIFRTAENARHDAYLEAIPSVGIAARFGAHTATLSARAATRRFARFSSENRNAVDVAYGGQIDLGPPSTASFRTTYGRESEQRGSAGLNLVAAGPAELQRIESSASVSTEFRRLGVSASVGIARRSYDALRPANSPAISQAFRDIKALRVGSRVNFRAGPAATIFASGAANRTQSIERSQGQLRDATGYTLLAGLRSDTESLIVGEVGIGWRGQNYRNPAFRDFAGLTYDATVDWYPTRLVSVRVQAGQEIVNSNFANVAGIVRRSVGATFFYDPLRKLRFVFALNRELDDYRELGLSTQTTSAGLTGNYQIGRRVDVNAFGRIISKGSSNVRLVERYASFAFGIGLTGKL